MERKGVNTSGKCVDHSWFLAEFECFNHEALEIIKIVGGLNPTLVVYRDGEPGMINLENSFNLPFASAVKKMVDKVQPDAFIAMIEFSKDSLGPIYGQLHRREEMVILSIRSRDGVIKKDTVYSHIRDENGHIIGFYRHPDERIYFPEWGEKSCADQR